MKNVWKIFSLGTFDDLDDSLAISSTTALGTRCTGYVNTTD